MLSGRIIAQAILTRKRKEGDSFCITHAKKKRLWGRSLKRCKSKEKGGLATQNLLFLSL